MAKRIYSPAALKRRRAQWRQWYREHRCTPEARAVRQKRERDAYRADPRRGLLSRAKQRARRLGLEFALLSTDIKIPKVCPVLGVRLAVGDPHNQSNSPSLDRIDNRRGYLRHNVAVISKRANQIKNDATPEELRRVAAYIEAMRRQ